MKRTLTSSNIFKTILAPVLLFLSLLVSIPAYAKETERIGKVSWYGPGFHLKRTANGEIFDQNRLTAASNIIPMGKKVKITCTTTGRSVVVKINDTGGFSRHGRIFDLSKAAFNAISDTKKGVTTVRYTVLD